MLAAAAAAVAGFLAALGGAGCGSFRANDADDDAADGASPDGAARPDAANDAGPGALDAADCIDLTAGPAAFVPAFDDPKDVSTSDAGLVVRHVASSSATTAQWDYALAPPAGMTGATVAIDATIDMPDP